MSFARTRYFGLLGVLTFFVVALTFGSYGMAASSVGQKTSTADHAKFKELKGPFASGPEVTQACLQCHTEAAKQIHKTTHWTWNYENPVTGQKLGKKNVINNFCIAAPGNWPRCTSCHIGYGWKDDSFDFTADNAVDCLVCHADAKLYKKYPTDAGHPAYVDKKFPPGVGKMFKAVDLVAAAQSVSAPTRANCGACHFFGGGGHDVKHGDLDTSLFTPNRDTDIHMNAEGLNFSCTTCHTTGGHEVSGTRYATKAKDPIGIDVPGHTDDTRATCESCHGMKAHPADNHPKLNDHTDKVACTTCHVPEFARGGRKTKTWWDWSTAGKLNDKGKPLVVTDDDGYHTYMGQKGDFTWESNVTPSYHWFNGTMRFTVFGDKIDDSGVVEVNSISGSFDDPDSRIWPFKVMRGRQPYDKQNKVFALPHLFGKDQDAFWGKGKFNWDKALAAGMQAHNIPFSGDYGFVETRYYWPILHMVAPKEQAVQCNECHTVNGRLASLTGFYMPGRDSIEWLSRIGWILAGLTLAGSLLHGLLRIALSFRGKGKKS